MSSPTKYAWMTRVRIDVLNQNGEPLSVHVRTAQAKRSPGWEVFVDGGLLADGRDCAFLPTLREAVAYATDEALRAQAVGL